MNWNEFITWENVSRDTIDVKTIYIDIAGGDLVSGVFLSQLVYWYLPNKKGDSKIQIKLKGEYWIAKDANEWYQETRIKKRQLDRIKTNLVKLGLIEVINAKFKQKHTSHYRIIQDKFLEKLEKEYFGKYQMVLSKKVPFGTFLESDEMVLSTIQRLPTETTTESLNITPSLSGSIKKDTLKSVSTKKDNRQKPKLQKIPGQSVLSFYKTNDITEKILLKLVDNPDQDIVNRLNNDLADNDILEELEILLKDVLATVRIMPANLRKKIEKLLIVVSAPKSILEKAIKVVASREKTNSISYLAGVVSRMQKKAIKA